MSSTTTFPTSASTISSTPGAPVGPVPACDGLATVPAVDQLDRLAHLVADEGITAHEDRLNGLLAAAVAHGVCEVLIGTVADTSASPIMRERALGHLLAALA